MVINSTIVKKDANNIGINIFGGEKIKISCILIVADNGNKLSPVLIFKTKKDGRLEKSLNELALVNQKNFCLLSRESMVRLPNFENLDR